MKLRYLAVVALAAVSTLAQAQSKPDDLIRMRQGAMELIGRNVGALAAVAKGDAPFNKEAVLSRAEYINYLATDLYGAGYAAGSDKGAPTRASAKIWSDPEGYKAAAEKMTTAVRKLNTVTDVASLKTALGDVQTNCRSCHESYRDSSFH